MIKDLHQGADLRLDYNGERVFRRCRPAELGCPILHEPADGRGGV
jgi:hypothetical protein